MAGGQWCFLDTWRSDGNTVFEGRPPKMETNTQRQRTTMRVVSP